jgi:hypothetical protein
MKNTSPSHLSDDELVAEMNRLARCERHDMASLIAHIAEFDSRQLHLAFGYGSLTQYCREVLRLSEHETWRRIEVARVARKYPLILEKLADGSMNLTTIDLVAPQLRPDNHKELLDEASGKSKYEVQVQVAALAPKPDVPFTTRALPAPAAPASLSFSPSALTPPAEYPSYKPLSPGRERVCFTMDTTTIAKLHHAQDLLGHAIPKNDPGQVIDRALDLLIKDIERKKCGITDRPRPGRRKKRDDRYIPAEVRREVWRRDGGRCAFIGKTGRRCNSTSCLQYHHVDPRGPATVANIQLRCAVHNRYEADLVYGPTNKLKYAGVVSERRASYRAPPRATRSGPISQTWMVAERPINKDTVVTPAGASQGRSRRTRSRTRSGTSWSMSRKLLVDHLPRHDRREHMAV